MTTQINSIAYSLLVMIMLTAYGCATKPSHKVASNPEELTGALSTAQPGDTIIMANGEWKDADLLVEGTGTKDSMIVVMAEEAGKVILTGNSTLRVAGEYLVVSGLYFRDGHTLTSEVISFKKDKNTLANYCRITQCTIEDYSNPERHESDYWVGMYGKNNRFDHNALVGKGNKGVTMAVRLNNKESQDNHHLIDHNYFGPRPNLGSNGGETLRIGTSHYSLTSSNTKVVNNYFDRCNGEHEIISNKSGGNLFKGNTFYECVGTLTFRHGNDNIAESNAFYGNRMPNTGGIRVINKRQKVFNNYGYGLTGHWFRGALVVMNGVPNSPINRYHQVDGAEIFNNTFVDCDYVQLCAGSDEERSAVPINSVIRDNVFWNTEKQDVFTVYDDISGIEFTNNYISPTIKNIIDRGFSPIKGELKKDGNIYRLDGGKGAGLMADFEAVSKDKAGPSWYLKPGKKEAFDYGQEKVVKEGADLYDEIAHSKAGDILVLEPGDYLLTKVIELDHPISIVSSGGATIKFEKSNLFAIENGGSLKLKGITIDGAEAPDYAGNAVIRTSRYSMNKNYQLWIEDCEFKDLDVNHSFHVLDVYKNTFADSIMIKDSNFTDVSGSILALDKENEDRGIYNAEYVVLENSTFNNIGQPIMKLYRGGSDESTFGPILTIADCDFEKVGFGPKNDSNKAMVLHGVQKANIENTTFSDTKELNIFHTVGEPVTVIESVVIDDRSLLQISDNTATIHNLKEAK
ncbi:alginate lyase [Echinicola strongylocentroti]|uniref:Alginate lyase n=1 Tax=Echinicola strongylocentroti TaxID=1795355 RepID=A0A2Z4ICS9_9BACT|nr:polysaccharide lyase 6 family protein [Echinicola strongylocentroti]AWW28791.1 alginate lyase [Echinicola strongylocentroti]